VKGNFGGRSGTQVHVQRGADGSGYEEALFRGIPTSVLRPETVAGIRVGARPLGVDGIVVESGKNLLCRCRSYVQYANGTVVRSRQEGCTIGVPL
jgi:hypothetical protein